MHDGCVVVPPHQGGLPGDELGARAALGIPGRERHRERGVRAREVTGGECAYGVRQVHALAQRDLGEAALRARERRGGILTRPRVGQPFRLQHQRLRGSPCPGLRRRLRPLGARLGGLTELLEAAGIPGMLLRIPHGIVRRAAREPGGEER